MALSIFISKLNWRLILIYFIAGWFLCHALLQFFYLRDYDFIKLVRGHKYEDAIKLYSDKEYPLSVRVSNYLVYAAYAELAGVLIGFIISLIISLTKKWASFNSIIVLVVVFASLFLDRFYWDHYKFIFMFPGMIFKSAWWFDFTGSLFMLIIALFLFFWKGTIRFIGSKKTVLAATI